MTGACALLSLLGCQPSITPSSQPTPRIFDVQITPGLDRLRPAMHDCAGEEGIGLTLTSLPASALNPAQSGLALRWSAPSDTQPYAGVLGQEALVFIVPIESNLRAITRAELRAIYTGSQLAGSAVVAAEMQPWAYPQGDDVQQAFETSVLQHPPEQALPVFLAPDPSAMLEAVAQEPAAIGFVPSGYVNEQVRVLEVSDMTADQINQPILALSPAEPQGALRDWLLCLQARLDENP